MVGDTPAGAVQRYLDALQLALSCITSSVLNNFGGYHVTERPHIVTLGDSDFVRLASSARLSFAATQHYRVIESPTTTGPWKVTTVAYFYTLLDNSSHEILAYHWHPLHRASVTGPHLHLGYGATIGRSELANAHLPSGRVSLESIIRLLVTELGVNPKRHDWADALTKSEAFFESTRTW